MNNPKTHCGFVALIGRANVGKSSLFNLLLGEPLSLVNRKAQTTRHCMRGILSDKQSQAIFIDTPGLDTRNDKLKFNQQLNGAFDQAIKDVDVVVWMLDRNLYTNADNVIMERLGRCKKPVIVVINKMDLVTDLSDFLPFVQKLHKNINIKIAETIPMSVKNQDKINDLKKAIFSFLPESQWLYGEDDLTDAPMKFFASEMVRGELLKQLNQELPYATAVAIDSYKEDKDHLSIMASIIVETTQHKHIVIGKSGSKIKSIGQTARLQLQKKAGKPVELRLWVKVIKNWRNLASSGLHNLTPN